MNWLKRILSKLRRKPCYEVYRSIEEMPISVWNKIHTTNELSYIVKSGECPPEKRGQVWDDVLAEYFGHFGFSQKYLSYLRQLRKLVCLEVDLALTGNTKLKTFIKIAERELDLFTDKNEMVKFEESLALIERHFGFRINPKETTVMQFYNYVRLFEREMKEKEKAIRKTRSNG